MNLKAIARRQFATSLLAPLLHARNRTRLVFSCDSENDFYRLLAAEMPALPRYRTPNEAIHRAPKRAGVLLLSDTYPDAPTPLTEQLLRQAREKQLRVYAEYVSPSTSAAFRPFIASKQRGVITSSFFGNELPAMSLLALHSCHVYPLLQTYSNARIHIALAKVAGYNQAIYGLPKDGVPPLLVEQGGEHLLLATTQLSRFITARYGPTRAWRILWGSILRWLVAGNQEMALDWTPAVHPSWRPSDRLPNDAEKTAALRGSRWYFNARLFVHPAWADRLQTAKAYEDRVGPAPKPEMPIGDGSLGMLEGHSSLIQLDGSQPARWWIRADCVGETSMVLALAAKHAPQPEYRQIAGNLCDFLIAKSKMANGSRLDPANVAYGLIGWNEADKYYKDEDGYDVYYGDDNARCLLGVLSAAVSIGETRWYPRLWLAVLANFRLVGTLGHQKSRYDQAPLAKDGWQHYHNSAMVLHDMNYQAYPWALFLWAFSVSGYRPFLDRCQTGIRLSVEAYPQWRWSNSITSQLARLLLPLAWLVRVNDTPETRSWLLKISQELLAHQHSSGAIAERTGPPGTGIQKPPKSNEEYGGGEGALIQENGDPAADLLYTMNFAFIGLHEAYAATGDASYKQASDSIADFLVRVQAQSTIHPQFDGAWYRAFDFKNWDYWASNSDAGWGAWCTESGWSQSWISTVFSLRVMQKSLWEVLRTTPPFPQFDDVQKKMFPS